MEQALLDTDKDGAKSFLCTSDPGRRLHMKSEFKDLETKPVDFIQLGEVGAWNTTQ
jgi:hypothetical protein